MLHSNVFRTEAFRFTAKFAIGLLCVAALWMAAVYWITTGAFTAALLNSVSVDIGAVTRGYTQDGLEEAVEVVGQRLATPGLSDFIILQDNTGKKIAGNMKPLPSRIGRFEMRLAEAADTHVPEQEGRTILGKGTLLPNGDYLFVGEDTHEMRETRARLFLVSLGLVGGLAAFVVIAGLLFSRRMLRRVDQITETCNAIISGHLTSRIPEARTRGELERVTDAVNKMLDEVGALVQNQRSVASTLAHDLRVPLANLRHRLEVVDAETASIDDYRRAIHLAISDVNGILEIFTALLRIARVRSDRKFAMLNLADVLFEVRDVYASVIEDSGRVLETNITPNVRIAGDKILLIQMFTNLVENAIRHTPAGTRISMELVSDGDQCFARVSDNGGGVPAECIERIYERYYSAGHSREGAGIGLALVSAIAEIHEMHLTLSNGNSGLCVTLTIPTAVWQASSQNEARTFSTGHTIIASASVT